MAFAILGRDAGNQLYRQIENLVRFFLSLLGIDVHQIRAHADAFGQIDDCGHVWRFDPRERLMDDGKDVHFTLVGEGDRPELVGRAALRACDPFRIQIDCAACAAFDSFQMRLGREFEPWNDWTRASVSSLSLLSHTDPPNQECYCRWSTVLSATVLSATVLSERLTPPMRRRSLSLFDRSFPQGPEIVKESGNLALAGRIRWSGSEFRAIQPTR